jgi:hypothetical protein
MLGPLRLFLPTVSGGLGCLILNGLDSMPDGSNKSTPAPGEGSKAERVNVNAGLCVTCAHVRQIESAKGSSFVLCTLSASDSQFPKYPRLPVLSCGGYLRQE